MIQTPSKHIYPITTVILGMTSLFLPALWVFGLPLSAWGEPARLYSLLAMGVVSLSTLYSIGRFSLFLSYLGVRHILFTFLFYDTIVLGIIGIFHLAYSIYYLSYASFLLLLSLFILAYLKNHPKKVGIGYIPIGDEETFAHLPKFNGIKWYPLTDPASFDTHKMEVVMADFNADLKDEWLQFLADCALKHIPVYNSNHLLALLTGRLKITHLYENNLGTLLPSKQYATVKRILDTTLILLTLPFTLPVMLITALFIFLESPGNVFFLQTRIGQGGKPFTMYKFRSMCTTSEIKGPQMTAENDARITRVGKFIRKTRLDELPQLLNVLRGEMSLIGPRPEQPSFVASFKKVIPFYDYRHIIRPGVSGWSHVCQGYCADTESIRERLEYDFYYIKNYSFSLDLLILFKTLKTMATGFGAR